MDKFEKYYSFSDSEINFRNICGMNDSDPELEPEDVYFNLSLLLQTAHNYIKDSLNKEKEKDRENACYSCIGDWIIKSQIVIATYIKNFIIKRATSKYYAIIENCAPGKKFSISELMLNYHGGHLFKYKDYTKVTFTREDFKSEEVLRKAINKFNYDKYKTITRGIFETNIDKMIDGCFEDECLMIFAVLLVKSGATMDLRCYKLITAQIKKIKKNFTYLNL